VQPSRYHRWSSRRTPIHHQDNNRTPADFALIDTENMPPHGARG